MRTIIFLLTSAIFFAGCVKEDHFGQSDRAQIKTFIIPGQSGNTIINNDSLTVVVPIPETTTDFILTPSEITVSNFASVSPKAGEAQDFNSPIEYTVTAEDGTVSVYEVRVQRSGSQPQLDNASFEDWYIETVVLTSVEQPELMQILPFGERQTAVWH